MGHESDGLFSARPKLEELFIQVIADNFIQCTKGFVHQQDIRVKRERAGN